MEMTIIQWSKSFGCDGETKDLHLVVAIAAVFAVMNCGLLWGSYGVWIQ